MTKKKRNIFIIILTCLLILFTFSWVFNYKIIDGHYDRLTITKMGEPTEFITKKEEIEKIITQINNSPRHFNPNTGFRYDYLPRGILIFENEKKKFELGFVLPKGNILTK